MTTAIKIKRALSTAFTILNPVLENGEQGFELDTQKVKVGDGVTAWADLPHIEAVPLAHTHGPISNAGAIGTTANLPIITTTGGVLTTGVFGTGANQFCQGNDSRLSNARPPTSHSHGSISDAGTIGSMANRPLITTTNGSISTTSFGTAANTVCQGNDSRLSNARTPTSHTHGNITNAGAIGTTANLPLITTTSGVITVGEFGTGATNFAAGNHVHGNISNAGAIGTTANLPIITTTSGVLTAGAFGTTANSFCQGNDARLSDARTPTSHASTHQTGGSDAINNVVTAPTELTGDVNDYAIGTGDIFTISADAARNITGVVAAANGKAILLVNTGSHAITLKHESASSTAANRITVPSASDYVLTANGGSALLIYFTGTSRWRVI